MKVYVVMGNDFPDTVYRLAANAQSYIENKKKEDKEKWEAEHPHRTLYTPRIYWRMYEFELK